MESSLHITSAFDQPIVLEDPIRALKRRPSNRRGGYVIIRLEGLRESALGSTVVSQRLQRMRVETVSKFKKKRGEGSSEAQEKDPGTPPPIPTTEDKEPGKKTTKEETMRRLLKIILPALRLKKVDTFLWLTHKSLTPIHMQEDNKF
ncbi:hypothetical protein Tco_1268836 [Tanacetum coccineum]